MRLWTGQAVSQFGSMVTRDALPLIAVLVLQATPVQMGLLSAAGFAPVLVVGLLAGGVLGEILGIRPVIWLAALGVLLSWLWLAFSPVAKLRSAPLPADD